MFHESCNRKFKSCKKKRKKKESYGMAALMGLLLLHMFHSWLTYPNCHTSEFVLGKLRIEFWSKHQQRTRNFETNMFRFGTASSIVVRSLATWSAFGCRQNVIAIFLFSEWLIYGVSSSPLSTTIEVFLFYMWYILTENFALNFFFLICSRKITAM